MTVLIPTLVFLYLGIIYRILSIKALGQKEITRKYETILKQVAFYPIIFAVIFTPYCILAYWHYWSEPPRGYMLVFFWCVNSSGIFNSTFYFFIRQLAKSPKTITKQSSTSFSNSTTDKSDNSAPKYSNSNEQIIFPHESHVNTDKIDQLETDEDSNTYSLEDINTISTEDQLEITDSETTSLPN